MHSHSSEKIKQQKKIQEEQLKIRKGLIRAQQNDPGATHSLLAIIPHSILLENSSQELYDPSSDDEELTSSDELPPTPRLSSPASEDEDKFNRPISNNSAAASTSHIQTRLSGNKRTRSQLSGKHTQDLIAEQKTPATSKDKDQKTEKKQKLENKADRLFTRARKSKEKSSVTDKNKTSSVTHTRRR